MAGESDRKREMRKDIRKIKRSRDYMNKDVEALQTEFAEFKKENVKLKTKIKHQITQELEELRIIAKEKTLCA
ncbi:hypothetical protein HPB48_011573 [Haemaphysalis longicornis]|uniref:Uncharacterized protein n=1 Tax=Haemaphysalis longicornis TaxID=44386 RepID=A0A9J6G0L1_HAELO|nr:hypothetical protein HPB48_011573 [Haemaphysalis longicornis]